MSERNGTDLQLKDDGNSECSKTDNFKPSSENSRSGEKMSVPDADKDMQCETSPDMAASVSSRMLSLGAESSASQSDPSPIKKNEHQGAINFFIPPALSSDISYVVIPYEPADEDSTDVSYLKRDNFRIARAIQKGLHSYGTFLIDNFMPTELAEQIVTDVKSLESENHFLEVKGVVGFSSESQRMFPIRWGSQIAVVGSQVKGCDAIRVLAMKMLNLARTCIKPKYDLCCSLPMVERILPDGTYFSAQGFKPAKDGGLISAIYFLNKDWDKMVDGGQMRIHPRTKDQKLLDIDPHFNRLVFYLSDLRNPIQVLPTLRKRFCIGVHYFHSSFREAMEQKYAKQRLETTESSQG